MTDAPAAPRGEGPPACTPTRRSRAAVSGAAAPSGALSRRRVLALAVLTPVAAVGSVACGSGTTRGTKEPDPLIALADAARADAALAAALAASPELRARVEPLRAARTAHAAALDAAVVRAGGTAPASSAPASSAPAAGPPSSGPTAPPTGASPAVTLARVREAVAASHRAAAQLVPDLPAERVGLVASVAACCATYATVLG